MSKDAQSSKAGTGGPVISPISPEPAPENARKRQNLRLFSSILGGKFISIGELRPLAAATPCSRGIGRVARSSAAVPAPANNCVLQPVIFLKPVILHAVFFWGVVCEVNAGRSRCGRYDRGRIRRQAGAFYTKMMGFLLKI